MVLGRSPDQSNLSEQLLRQAPWPSLMTIESKIWSLKCEQGFSVFGQCELVFNPKWPIFELDQEIIKTNFQTNFQDILIKTVATSVNKIFLFLAPVT
jgi:hypothetical protein